MAAGTYTSRATAKFWIMPRTGPATLPVDSAATGATATKGFNLVRDLIGGLPELDDQIGGAMVGTSGQTRSERVGDRRARPAIVRRGVFETTAPRTPLRPPWSEPGRCSRLPSSTPVETTPPRGAASWNTRAAFSVAFNVQFGNRKIMAAVGVDGDDAITGLSLTFMPDGRSDLHVGQGMHIKHAFIRSSRLRVLDDLCPDCHVDLDTGWECNSCGMDWYWTAFAGFGLKTKIHCGLAANHV